MCSLAFADFKPEALTPEMTSRESGLSYALFENQTVLADNVGFSIEIPVASASLHNLAKVMTSEKGPTVLSNLFKSNNIKDNLINLAACLVDNAGGGRNTLTTLNAGTAFSFNSFAMGFNASVKVPTEGNGSSIKANLEGQASLTLAYGRSVFNDGKTRIAVGFALRPSYLIYSETLSVETISKILSTSDTDVSDIIENLNFNAGLGLPFDLSASFIKYDGKLQFNVQAFNLNGYYLVNENFKITEIKNKIRPSENHATVKTPMELNFNVVYQPKLKYVKPTVTLGFNNINGFITDQLADKEKPSSTKLKNTLLYLNADVNLNLFDFADLKAGVHGGYFFSTLSFGLSGNKFDIAYYWSEFGDELGEKGVDTLSLRIRLGF